MSAVEELTGIWLRACLAYEKSRDFTFLDNGERDIDCGNGAGADGHCHLESRIQAAGTHVEVDVTGTL